MGKLNGFLEYTRTDSPAQKPLERIRHWDEFHAALPLDERQRQGARCMACGVPFCQFSCPLQNLTPEWNDLIYRGHLNSAAQRLLKTNNFPEFTGRVCPALCEAACTCAMHGDAVTVRENELGIIEDAFARGLMRPRVPQARSGKTVAVVGSGPAGLAAADQLNRRGHRVVVYERDGRLGGLLMYGIPNMKLDKAVIQRRIDLMTSEGVEFVTGVDVGRDMGGATLTANHDAVLLCCGARNPRALPEIDASHKDVHYAVDYLTAATKSLLDGGPPAIDAKGKHVVIVGGGDTGNDCVATCIRQGCESVRQLEVMAKPPGVRAENNPWPEWSRIAKTDYGQQEAIAVFGDDPRLYQTTVAEMVTDENDNLMAVKTTTGDTLLLCDLLLVAIGFTGSEAYVPNAFGAKPPDHGHFTGTGNVFMAGDMRRGQSLVVWAIAEGRAAAREIDEYMMGYSNL